MSIFRKIFADQKGVAATELAFVMPVLMGLIYGVVELGNALLLDRKVTAAIQTAADLVAQERAMDTTAVNEIFDAMDRIIAPYSPDAASYVISSVIMTPQGQTEVDWSDARGSAAGTPGAAMAVPPGLVIEGDSVIVAEVSYNFDPILGDTLVSGFTISDAAYLKPRKVRIVTREN